MSQKFRLNFVQQNDSMISFLSAIVYLFYALISEYIETLNCLNFSKNWKNGGVLKLLTGRVPIYFKQARLCSLLLHTYTRKCEISKALNLSFSTVWRIIMN